MVLLSPGEAADSGQQALKSLVTHWAAWAPAEELIE